MSRNEKNIAVSVILPMKNSSTTIIQALKSILRQQYSNIQKIIIVDNASADSSVMLVKQFAATSKVPVLLIERKKSKTVAASYNLGVSKAKSPFVIFMHSDSSLPSPNEINKLLLPFTKDPEVVATYSIILHPEKLWNTYNFWMKAQFSRHVGKESPGLNGKFDCIKKEVFLKLEGFDEKNFGGNIGGGEDADLHIRLSQIGPVVLSSAKVIHLHYLGANYLLKDWIANRKLLARTYGRYLRVRWRNLPRSATVFAVKPMLAILPFIPHMFYIGIVILIIYSLFITKKMFTTHDTLRDPRILLLPFVNIFFVYYETFWMIEGFLSFRKQT